MLLFKPEHDPLILSGKKTQTRRIWKKPQVRVGSVHQARTQLFGKPFALLKIKGLRKEPLGNISKADCSAEGNYTPQAFRKKWIEINGSWNPRQVVWVVEFEVVHNCPF